MLKPPDKLHVTEKQYENAAAPLKHVEKSSVSIWTFSSSVFLLLPVLIARPSQCLASISTTAL